MLNNIAIFTNNKRREELYQFLSKVSPISVSLNPKVQIVQNANVFIDYYHRDFLSLDKSNNIYLICDRPSIKGKTWMLVPSIKGVIAASYNDGLNISWQLQSKGFNKRIVNLLPWCHSEPKQLKKGIHCVSLSSKYKKALLGKSQTTDLDVYTYVWLTEQDNAWPYEIVEAMHRGSIPIVSNRAPFNEFIINGHNGFLINKPGDIINALKEIESKQHWLSYNAKASINALYDSTRYLESILYPEELPNIKLNPAPITFSRRKWLVRDRVFKSGKLEYFPKDYASEFVLVDLDDIQEILNFFQMQEFGEAYVFGCDIPEELIKRDELQLLKSLSKLGRRSLQIHFCRNNQVPEAWSKVFSKLSIISVEEGLKQVNIQYE